MSIIKGQAKTEEETEVFKVRLTTKTEKLTLQKHERVESSFEEVFFFIIRRGKQ